MQDSTRSSAAGRERPRRRGRGRTSRRRAGRAGAGAPRTRRGWCARVCGPGERVGEVAQRHGLSRWQLSTWRSLARHDKLAGRSSAEAVGVEPQPQPAFAALEVDSATSPGAMGSEVVESREVTVRLGGVIDASRVAEIASALRGLRCGYRSLQSP